MNTITERLVGWGTFEELASSIKSLTFGELVKLATPILTRYHSDLWHDAQWLEAYLEVNIREGTVWYFAADDSGTAIGTDASYIKQRLNAPASRMWECRVGMDDNRAWYFHATEIGGGGRDYDRRVGHHRS